jgi:hypothetical protein
LSPGGHPGWRHARSRALSVAGFVSHFASLVAFADGCPLVVELLASGEPQFDLRPSLLEV